MWKELLSVFITSMVSLAVLFLLCKLMGNKQISQLSMFDYITGISIGSIAAEMATEIEDPLYPALAMILYALCAFFISVFTSRSLQARRFFTGKPLILLDNGIIYKENMRKARLDLSDFLTLCRIQGCYNVSDIQTAILEENGTVSFLQKSEARPLIPRDAAIFPQQEYVVANVILDGVLQPQVLSAMGRSEPWFTAELLSLGYRFYADIYLATLDSEGKVRVFPMTEEKKPCPFFD